MNNRRSLLRSGSWSGSMSMSWFWSRSWSRSWSRAESGSGFSYKSTIRSWRDA
jgi:hypothetical protein